MKLFSTEQVSKYHPDKYADQISDAILDACLAQDKHSHVACECLVKGTTIVLAGEITTAANIHPEVIARRVGQKLGYKVTQVINLIGQQSQEINKAVGINGEMGAGDQGIMFGYATKATTSHLPFGFEVANKIIKEIEWDVENNPMTILKGDAKTQVTVDLDQKQTFQAVKTVLVSVCHREYHLGIQINTGFLTQYIHNLLRRANMELPRGCELMVNPAGTWTIGGPEADCGLTGRKIVCDQYGGYVPVGGGAFSGKDPSKVDRSASYMARKLAVQIVEELGAAECEVQLAYAIGQPEPVSVSVTTESKKMDALARAFLDKQKLTPGAIIAQLNLDKPQYEKRAEGCHYYGNEW